MKNQTSETYNEALGVLRANLKLKRGYGSRLATKLKVGRAEIYNVAWGRAKNPKILKALIDEAQNTTTPAEQSLEIITSYLSGAAA